MSQKTRRLFRRRRYLVEKGFQLRFAGMILLFMFAVALFCSLTIYYNTWMLLGEKLANVYPQGRLAGILKQANFVLFKRLLLITPLVGILAIVLSHRIAGPIFRIKKTLDEIIKGDYSKRLHLRNTDELKDVAESINSLMELLEKKKNKV